MDMIDFNGIRDKRIRVYDRSSVFLIIKHIYVYVDVEEWGILIDLPGMIHRWQEEYDKDERELIPPEEIGMIFIKNWNDDISCIHYIALPISHTLLI